MPGKTYDIRVRAIDAQGNLGLRSEKQSYLTPPCWVYRKFWETGVQTVDAEWAKPPPPEWAGIENTLTCKEK